MRRGLEALRKGHWHAAVVAVAAVVTLTVAGGTATMAAPAGAAVPAVATVPAAGSYAEFYDVATGRCLDSNAAGNAYTNPCQAPGNTYQDWRIYTWAENFPDGTEYFFSFQDDATGRCLDSNSAGNLYTNPCQAPGNTYQTWWSTETSSFFDGATGRCLDSNSTGNAYTLPCNGGLYQYWDVFAVTP
jgi:Ricin-type beta-trefoil lectin domain